LSRDYRVGLGQPKVQEIIKRENIKKDDEVSLLKILANELLRVHIL
jgi:hypothetical protein